jgi:phosphoribosylanthranilate isomerase
VIKALSIAQPSDLELVEHYRGVADRLLFDAKAPQHASRPGGNGLAFDWSLLAAVWPEIDYLLSGGLNADNVEAALAQASPGGIDISSGVESAPGVKDPALIAAFFRAVRQAERAPRGGGAV